MAKSSASVKKSVKAMKANRSSNTGRFVSSELSSFSYYATHNKERAVASARFRTSAASSRSISRRAR